MPQIEPVDSGTLVGVGMRHIALLQGMCLEWHTTLRWSVRDRGA